jgi:hypothetical protein
MFLLLPPLAGTLSRRPDRAFFYKMIKTACGKRRADARKGKKTGKERRFSPELSSGPFLPALYHTIYEAADVGLRGKGFKKAAERCFKGVSESPLTRPG